jgi:tetratricopeptide (TPR) repeat protein
VPGILLFLLFATPQGDEARVHFERGRALFEEHDDSGDAEREAESEFRRALALDPKIAAAVAYLGFIEAGRGRHTEAEAAYRRAIAMDPRSPEARVGLAWISLRAGKRDEGLGELRQAVKDGPKNRLALRELAGALASETADATVEMVREAIPCWEALIVLDRDDRDARYDLARAYRRLKDWPGAEREFREVLRIGQTPDDMDVWVYAVHLDLAEALERQGKYDQAIREYEALIASQGAGEDEIGLAKSRIEALLKIKPQRR